MAPKITLYLDIVSPFAYLSYHILKNSPTFAKCEITYVPIFLGGVMKACGNTPPINIKNKDQWINKERQRWARTFNIPMKETMPDGFPPLTLGVQRALCAITANSPQNLIPCLDALYHSFWNDGNGQIGTPEGFGPVLEGVLGKEGAEKVIADSTTPAIKALLNKNTEAAIEDGAFGLPWFVCTNEKGEKEGFWGVDHLGQVALFLGLDRSVDGGFRALL